MDDHTLQADSNEGHTSRREPEPAGQPMSVQLRNVTFSSGHHIQFSPGVTALVGPNNVGKSRILQDLFGSARIDRHRQPPPIWSTVGTSKRGTLNDAEEWCSRNLVADSRSHGEETRYTFNTPDGSSVFTLRQLRSTWHSDKFHGLAPFFLFLSADDRASLTKSVKSIAAQRESPRLALQKVWRQPELEKQLSKLTEQAFGTPISVHRHGGAEISLHYGKPDSSPFDPDQLTEYLDEMASIPEVHSQGHGLRSFVGLLMEIIAGNHPVLLIDEPEAFLHPPQARLLGRILATVRQQQTQIVIATHSSDILYGLVDGTENHHDLSIARITRDGDKNFVAQIAPDTITALYENPLLRHSRLLDGLFYSGVVLCESDGDATFYGATEAAIEQDQGKSASFSTLLFTHTNGGYSRFPDAVHALRSANVPIAVVVDMDVLGNAQGLESMVEVFGTTVEALGCASDLKHLRDHLAQLASDPVRSDVRKLLQPIFDQKEPRNLSQSETQQIRRALSAKSGWQQLKEFGDQLVRGETYNAVHRIISVLRTIGVFVVPVGELEGFNRAYPAAPKSQWLNSALTDRFDQQSGPHQEFVRAIRAFIESEQAQV